MANNISSTLYTENDYLVVVSPTRTFVNTAGVISEEPWTGLTITAFLSLSGLTNGTATAINAALSKTLTQVGTTGVYQGTFDGNDLTTYLGPLADGATVYLHIRSGSDYWESAAITVKRRRAAS